MYLNWTPHTYHLPRLWARNRVDALLRQIDQNGAENADACDNRLR